MTRRLPATLKKRLQANLETLTPLEAGRLALVYFHESTGKKIRVTDYPPMKELLDAMENRVEKARKKPTEKEAVAAYNGFLFLVGLVETVNVEAPNRLLGAAFSAYQTQTLAGTILQQDAAGYVVSELVKEILRQPQPLDPKLYDQVVAWLNGDRLCRLSEVVDGELESEEMNILESESLQIPKEFAARYPIDPSDFMGKIGIEFSDAISAATEQERQMRQDWAEAQGEEWLRSAFDNRSDRLEQWIKFSDGYYTEADRETRQKAILADLVAKSKTGELVGGEAVYHASLYAPVLIDAGHFPTWAALRLLWRPFAESRDARFDERATVATHAPGRADVVRDLKGRRLSPEELRELVADFWKACRGRSWGKKLPAKTDFDALAGFLTWSPSPLLHLLAPDLGTVVFATWERADGHALQEGYDQPWVKGPAATAASLHVVIGGHDWGESEIAGDRFFRNTTGDFFQHNESLDYWLSLTDRLMPRRQLFTYRNKQDEEEGLLPMSAIFGFELMTLLETTFAKYQRSADQLASIKAAIAAIGDRYFGGMPVLTKIASSELEQAEGYLENAAKWLKNWLDDLETAWNVDTTNLDIGEPEADEETVGKIVAGWLEDARRLTRIKDETGLLW